MVQSKPKRIMLAETHMVSQIIFSSKGGCGVQSQLFVHTYVALHIILHMFIIRVTYYILHSYVLTVFVLMYSSV